MAFIGKQPTPVPLTANDITDGIISTDKLADTSVTNAKINADLISAETELATAPADTDEFLISDAGTLKRIDASLVGGGGKVLQVVSTTKTDTQTISSTSDVQISGLTAALTCASTSNKVLITGVLSVGGTTNDAGYRIYADSSIITAATGDAASSRRRTTFGGGAFLRGGNETNRVYTIPFSFLYSPSSTSAITYSIYKSDSGSTATYINRSATDNDSQDRQRAISTITVVEIAG